MNYPIISEYIQAIKSSEDNFDQLKHLRPVLDEDGQYIVEFEQQGSAKAKYGTSLLSNLAKLLRARVGRGYRHPNLNNMRKFYLMYPNFQISDKFGLLNLQTNGICQLTN